MRSAAALIRRLARCAAVVPWMLAAAPLAAQERGAPAGVVAGSVHDAAGRPVAGAMVALAGTRRGTVSDSAGRFVLAGLPPRAYAATVSRIGFRSATEAWVVASDTLRVRVVLAAEAVALEGLTVRATRFERRLQNRLRASPHPSRAFGERDFRHVVAANAADYVRWYTGLALVACADRRAADCVYRRGRLTPVFVVVDEMPAVGGLAELGGRGMDEIHRVEVIDGTMVRVYTRRFVAQAERSDLRPVPF
jgi:hypothetical protein